MLKQQIADLLAVQQEQRAAAAAAAAAAAGPALGSGATAAATSAVTVTAGPLTGLTHAQMEAVAARKAAVRTFLAYRTSGIKVTRRSAAGGLHAVCARNVARSPHTALTSHRFPGTRAVGGQVA